MQRDKSFSKKIILKNVKLILLKDETHHTVKNVKKNIILKIINLKLKLKNSTVLIFLFL